MSAKLGRATTDDLARQVINNATPCQIVGRKVVRCPTHATPRYLSTKQAAEYLGVHQRTLRNWVDQGKIKAHRNPGGRNCGLIPPSWTKRTPLPLPTNSPNVSSASSRIGRRSLRLR